MTDLRESVARAMWKDASERGADGFDSALDYQWHETDEDTRQTFLDDASAALRAVADAGFVIVPKGAMMDVSRLLARILKNGEIAVVDVGSSFASYGGKKPPNKEMWAVPRHMHKEIEEVSATIAEASA